MEQRADDGQRSHGNDDLFKGEMSMTAVPALHPLVKIGTVRQDERSGQCAEQKRIHIKNPQDLNGGVNKDLRPGNIVIQRN